MNGVVDTYALERQQARFIRWMMVLSLLIHGGVILLGSTISSLFPVAASLPVVTVELTDAPMSTLPEEEPLAPPAVVSPPARSVPPSDVRAPLQKPTQPPPANRWLEKLDAGLARMADAPVLGKTGKTGGLPTRHWVNESAPRSGDFAPAVAPEKNLAFGKHQEDLENRIRRSGRPGVGIGEEKEATVMFGGVGSSSGEPIPAWIRDMIRKRVRDYLPELEGVYTDAIRRNPDLHGKLLVRFRIDPSGKIQRVEPAEERFRDAAFVNAVLDKVRRWTFEPIGGRVVEVLYPFQFVPPS